MLAPHLLDGARWRGARVGLFGGTFDPPHAGHLHVARAALAALALDAVWWLVTPRNPMKSADPRDPTGRRLTLVHAAIAGHPAMGATDLEARLGTVGSFATVRALTTRFPATAFVWVGGADSAAGMHRWGRWRDLLALVPTLTCARPPAESLARRMPLGALAGQRHITLPPGSGGPWPLTPRTSYWLWQTRMVPASSTDIRAALTPPRAAEAGTGAHP